jgi:hypothetical protein
MAASRNGNKDFGWLAFVILGAFFAAALSLLWLVFRPQVATLYYQARNVETFGWWSKMSDWGYYFKSVRGSQMNWRAIYLSSIPFGMICAVVVLLIGFIVQARIRSKHIINFIRPNGKLGGGMNWKQLMERFAPIYPHNQFYLDYQLYRYSASKGPASQPKTALELLHAAGAIEATEEAETKQVVNSWKVRQAMASHFGQQNPFVGVNLRNEHNVRKALEQLEWYSAVILFAALSRIVGLHDQKANIKNIVDQSEEFFRDVWRDINREKKFHGEKLVLGPYDYAEPNKAKPSRGHAGVGVPKKMMVLTDHLKKVGPSFKTTRRAIDGLAGIIISSANEKQSNSAQSIIASILHHHGFVFGVLASSLCDGSDGTPAGGRTTGVMAPNTFNWLRFADRNLWRFLNYVGMQTPCPEAAGQFDHWRVELALKAHLSKPEISDATIRAVVTEARRQSPVPLTVRDVDNLRSDLERAVSAPQRLVEGLMGAIK